MGVPIKGRRLCGDGTDLHLVQSDSYIIDMIKLHTILSVHVHKQISACKTGEI